MPSELNLRVPFTRWAHSCPALLHRLREQWDGVGDTPGQGIRCSQGRSYPGKITREVCLATNADAPFEPGECPAQVTLAEGQLTNPKQGDHEARGMLHLLGNP